MAIRQIIRTALCRQIFTSSIKVVAVVGTVLNVVNQGGRIAEGIDFSWGQLAMNYLVPYCVASYSAARNQLAK